MKNEMIYDIETEPLRVFRICVRARECARFNSSSTHSHITQRFASCLLTFFNSLPIWFASLSARDLVCGSRSIAKECCSFFFGLKSLWSTLPPHTHITQPLLRAPDSQRIYSTGIDGVSHHSQTNNSFDKRLLYDARNKQRLT